MLHTNVADDLSKVVSDVLLHGTFECRKLVSFVGWTAEAQGPLISLLCLTRWYKMRTRVFVSYQNICLRGGAQAAEAEEAYEYFQDLLPEVTEFLILEGDLAGNEPAEDEGEEGTLLRFAAAQGLSEEELECLASDAADWVTAQDRGWDGTEGVPAEEESAQEMSAEAGAFVM